MASFTHMSTLVGGDLTHMSGISRLKIVNWNGTDVLYSGSFSDGGLNVFSLAAGQQATFLDQIGYSLHRGTAGLSDFDVLEVAGQPILVPSGRYDDRTAIHRLDATGAFESVKTLGANTQFIGNFSDAITITIEGKTFMAAAQSGQSGFRSFRIRDDLSLEVKAKFEDTSSAFTGDISAMSEAQVGGRSFFFAASALDAGVTSYWMGKWGNIKERDSVAPDDGPGFNAPSTLATTISDGKIYLLMGAAGTDSITSIRVNQFGGLFIEDHVMDSGATRFANIAALETFETADRSFVLAGGSDDGLSLFELFPGGKLFHLASIADDNATSLTNVSAIAADVIGNEVQVFASGEGAPGITQFSVDLGNLATPILGSDQADNLTGGAGDDLLMGFDQADTLGGGDGTDILVDGAGVDILSGGAGADVFVFVADGRLDRITDFEDGIDRIDLSDLPMLYAAASLDITPQSYGAMIRFGAERLRVETMDGQMLGLEDLTDDDFIF